jgi:hypothetical protein
MGSLSRAQGLPCLKNLLKDFYNKFIYCVRFIEFEELALQPKKTNMLHQSYKREIYNSHV